MSPLEGLLSLLFHDPRKSRRRPRPKTNPHQVYSKPLPLAVFPLPPIVPHNPISILYFAYCYFTQLTSPPSSHHRPRLWALLSETSSSVHVTDPETVRYVWESGFFGKGSLSRSEPTWLDREKRRLGLSEVDKSENYTATRRAERKKFKQDRAKKEQDAINEKLLEELLIDNIAKRNGTEGESKALTLRSKYEGMAELALSPSKDKFVEVIPKSDPLTSSGRPPTVTIADNVDLEKGLSPVNQGDQGHDLLAKPPDDQVIDQKEHLQLTPEEAFFIAFALGNLAIFREKLPSLPPSQSPTSAAKNEELSPSALLRIFLAHSSFPPTPPPCFDPACSFLLSYAVYHHFRSLGWVVRPGIKFGVDWLLYLRGPVFSHAEFAVVIRPAFSHSYWSSLPPEDHHQLGTSTASALRDKKDWPWFHCIQRVQAQVRKGLIFAWVDVPPPTVTDSILPPNWQSVDDNDLDIDIAALFGTYKVREMMMKRWIPNRNRD